ncbi:MAG: thiamine-phosphate kinase [Candidatus Heimdallarchaeota archaeon]|nr:thiamine-phosphate kinase [Candidatus Heimdallarchaeota archaeon]
MDLQKKIKDIGERGLLELFEGLIDEEDLPFNEDAVAFSISPTHSLLVNIDTFVAKTDAPPGMKVHEMGSKAVTMAVSDLAAKGAPPLHVLASGAFPSDLTVKETIDLVKAIRDAAHSYGAKFLGGDTNEADDIILSVVAIGIRDKKHIIRRSGAKEGEIICTTGEFGLTGAGFKVLLEGYNATPQQKELFKKAIFTPRARVREGVYLANFGRISSCIDSSDGLVWSLKEILRGKKALGIEIEHLPIPPEVCDFAKRNNLDAEELALFGGEEFELIFTLPEKDFKNLQERLKCHKIGRIVKDEAKRIILNTKGQKEEIAIKGWEHFQE